MKKSRVREGIETRGVCDQMRIVPWQLLNRKRWVTHGTRVAGFQLGQRHGVKSKSLCGMTKRIESPARQDFLERARAVNSSPNCLPSAALLSTLGLSSVQVKMVITTSTRVEPTPIDTTALQTLSQTQDDLGALSQQLNEALSHLHALQDKFESLVTRQQKALSQAPQTAAVTALHTRLHTCQQLMPATGGWFVKLFIGDVNVRNVRKSERLAFKHDYERLKLRLAPFFVVFCVACLAYADYRWLHMILQLSLTCYYVALAVRENVLRVNGSNIRAWWIIHHYFTMLQGVVMLTWPNNESYALFRTRLHLFGLYNAVLMIFQTRYQMARLYTLRSLGMVGEMDVASSDSPQIHWSETMVFLLPLILFGQLVQGLQGIFLWKLWRRFPGEVHIFLMAGLFSANFIGNCVTTVQTVRGKWSRGKRRSDVVEGEKNE